tara:strand:- start:70 stop:663 length:594 start_codon:yes stop_codon:yes gene_type:complete
MLKPEDLVPLMILEWTKGDKMGNTEIIKDIEVMGEFTWVNFEGGGRINGHVINEMMTFIGNAKPEDVNIHNNAKEQSEDVNTSVNPTTGFPKQQPIQTPVPTNTFGFDILDKANRDAKMDLNIQIDFDFISEDKLTMLLELYGAELFESLKDYVRQQLSEEVITGCIEQYLLHKFPQKEVVNTVEEVEIEDPEDILS